MLRIKKTMNLYQMLIRCTSPAFCEHTKALKHKHAAQSLLSSFVQSDLQPLVSPLDSSILQNCSADTERTMCKLNLSLCSAEASHQFFVTWRGQMTLIVFSCFALGTSVENVLTHSPWHTRRQEFVFVCVCESFSMLLWVYVCSPQATVNKMKY